MAAAVCEPPGPPPALVLRGDGGVLRETRARRAARPGGRALRPAGRGTRLQKAFHNGVVQASLRGELASGRATGLEAVFSEAAERLDSGQTLESRWIPIPTMFGRGRAVMGVQTLLLPHVCDAKAGGFAWKVAFRVKVLSRTTYASQAGIHFAARLVAAVAAPFDHLVTVVPDHRPVRDPSRPAVDPAFREHLSGIVIEQGDALFEEIRSSGSLTWTAVLTVQDVGRPVEDIPFDDCC